MVKVSLFLIFLLLLLPSTHTRSLFEGGSNNAAHHMPREPRDAAAPYVPDRTASSDSFFFKPKDTGPQFDPEQAVQGHKLREGLERRVVEISAEIIVTEGVTESVGER